ncbi:MAG: undecaprenyl-phosphate glucose phosphotransferase [Ruthenibacterium sp.]
MIKANQKIFNTLNALTDGVLFMLSFWVAYFLRFHVMSGVVSIDFQTNILVSVCYAVLMVFLYYAFQMYHSFRTRRFIEESYRIIEINFMGSIGFGLMWYWLRIMDFSRLMHVFQFVICTVLILSKRGVIRIILRYWRRKGYNLKHVLVVGSGNLAIQYCQAIKDYPADGFRYEGYVSDVENPALTAYLGNYKQLESVLQNNFFDEVIVALEQSAMDKMGFVICAAEKEGVHLSIIPDYNKYIPAHPTVDVIGDVKLISIRTSPLSNALNAFIKRAMDLVCASLAIIVSSPILLFAAIGTRLSSPGPVIFKQERVGLGKKTFVMYKFRSMRINDAADTAWSKRTDSRKTWFGSLLRKTSIDELPQLFNVLKGDMSLIGPRPELPHFVAQFKEEIPLYMVKHQVRPGITGWAQVNGYRGDTSIEERIKCDIYYIENWSFGFDMRIIFMTIFGGMLNNEKLAKRDAAQEEENAHG